MSDTTSAVRPDAPDSDLLTWRPLAADLVELWHPLTEAATAADHGTEHLSTDDLLDELAPDWIDPAADTVIGTDADGIARAFGMVQIRPGDVTALRAHCWGAVHPDWRGRGIGGSLLGWQLRRARALVAARRATLGGRVPAQVWLRADERLGSVARLAARHDLTPVRWFSVMRRDLAEPVPAPAVPDDLRLVPFTPDLDDAVRLAHNEAFTDHWGFQPWTAEAWRQWETGHRDFHAGWSFVVLDGDDVAGYALSAGYPSDWEAQGFTEGWTSKLGVRRGWRGRGLAKAVLAASMEAFERAGLQFAGLDVDSENPTGAVALYTGLGYGTTHREVQYGLTL